MQLAHTAAAGSRYRRGINWALFLPDWTHGDRKAPSACLRNSSATVDRPLGFGFTPTINDTCPYKVYIRSSSGFEVMHLFTQQV